MTRPVELAGYELLGRYGRGHRARPPEHLTDSSEVLVHVVPPETSDADYARVVNELRLLASLRSPYLAGLLDLGLVAGQLFYVLELPALGTLAGTQGTRTCSSIVNAVADAARGAHALHEAGVAHRDIKPANVFVTPGGALLADLGLAQLAGPGAAATGIGPVGAIEYLDPDLLGGSTACPASDVWALGVTLHRALTRAPLYPDLPRHGVLAAIRHVQGTCPRISPDLPPEVAGVIAHCLNPEADQRPRTARCLADNLEELIA